MAGSDNLYGTKEEWKELRDFLKKNQPYFLGYMYGEPLGEQRICYTAEIQGYLYEYCPLLWVKERMKNNFMVQIMTLGQPHHERDVQNPMLSILQYQ